MIAAIYVNIFLLVLALEPRVTYVMLLRLFVFLRQDKHGNFNENVGYVFLLFTYRLTTPLTLNTEL